jgi:hypothetical protein
MCLFCLKRFTPQAWVPKEHWLCCLSHRCVKAHNIHHILWDNGRWRLATLFWFGGAEASRYLCLCITIISHRAWVIWNRNSWIVVVPLLTLCGCVGKLPTSRPGETYSNHLWGILVDVAIEPQQKFFSTAANVLIMVNICLCTLLIIFRVWWVCEPKWDFVRYLIEWSCVRYAQRRLRYIAGINLEPLASRGIVVLIESGAIYTLCRVGSHISIGPIINSLTKPVRCNCGLLCSAWCYAHSVR